MICGDVLEQASKLPDGCIDYGLFDIPYGLGNREPSPAEILAYLQGASLRTNDFMGENWEIPSLAVWAQVYRVCKPGAHVFCFGGTRTWDLISLGIRLAGFTFRDTIARDYPALRWIQSQGMAKGQSVGKAIDKQAKGKARELEDPEAGGDEPSEFDGYGSCLAPTWEPILVFRKPLDGTLADNCLKHGVGALNIDACRTYTNWQEPDRPESWKASGVSAQPDVQKIGGAPPGIGITCHPKGRWPKNSTREHAPGCALVGTRKVESGNKSPNGGSTNGRMIAANMAGGFAHKTPSPILGYASPDGTETVQDWCCAPGCTVQALDAQAGVRKSGARAEGARRVGMGFGGAEGDGGPAIEASEGGASRFFPTFAPDCEPESFLYCPKATTAEKEAGCEALPAKAREDLSGRQAGSRGQLDGRAGVRRKGAVRNTGKCVKPQALIRWLARLGGKHGGLGLVLYCGTGSEMIGMLHEGMRVIGVERDPEMVRIAHARIAWWLDHPGGLTDQAKQEVKLAQAGQLKMF